MRRKIVLTGIVRCIDEYLVVKRNVNDDFMPGEWEFPGGNIEDNETILEALKRELKEEINLEIDESKLKIINIYDEIKEKDIKYHYIELDFLYEVENKDLNIKISNEHEEYKWVKKDSSLLDNFIKSKLKNI